MSKRGFSSDTDADNRIKDTTQGLLRREVLGGIGAAVLASTPVATASELESDLGSISGPDRQSSEPSTAKEVTESTVRSFFDEKINRQLEEDNIAGATVSVVADGETVFSKGYGFSDLENEEQVHADETLFRIGSVSKSVTGTAVMTAVEDGDVDLDTDVNEYLDEDLVPDTYDEPVTLEHLGTHTAGFETRVVGLFARDKGDVDSLKKAVQEVPKRVRPPGELASYSNYGVGLAGYVLSEATGTEFSEYVKQNVFDPLGMERSSFRQPPPEMKDSLSKGYTYNYQQGEFEEEGFEYIPLRSPGSMSATATDMARFMRAHLNGGILDGTRILSRDTTERMHGAMFRNHERLNGVGYGFYEGSRGDTRIVLHGGDTIFFHSVMALFPDEDVGVFVSYNTSGASQQRQDLLEDFIEEFFPPTESEEIDPEMPEEADELEGWYRTTRITETTYEKIIGAASMTEVRFEENGVMVTSPFIGGEKERWVQTDPLVFRKQDGNERLAFRKTDGEVTHFFKDYSPVTGMESLSTAEEPITQMTALGASVALILSGVTGWSGAYAWRRLRRKAEMYIDYEKNTEESPREEGEQRQSEDDGYDHTGPQNRGEIDEHTGSKDEDLEKNDRRRLARWVAGATGVSLIGSLFLFVLTFVVEPLSIVYGMPRWFGSVFVLSGIGIFGAVSAVGLVALAWRDSYWSTLQRVHYTLVVLSVLVLVWLLNYWNLLPSLF
jgi:CubicO group peptidase (beta-lactamase class C family)